MLAQHRRWWANIKLTLFYHLKFVGSHILTKFHRIEKCCHSSRTFCALILHIMLRVFLEKLGHFY